jgi:hypothetical protein
MKAETAIRKITASATGKIRFPSERKKLASYQLGQRANDRAVKLDGRASRGRELTASAGA